jgi:hypothetical protein
MSDEEPQTHLRPARRTETKVVSSEKPPLLKFEDEEFSNRVLSLLRGSGEVGQAFQRLCERGCDKHSLEQEILSLRLFPYESSRRGYTAADERKLGRIVKNLDRIAKELRDTKALIRVTTVRRPRTMLSLSALGRRIACVANQLRAAIGNPKWKGFRTLTAADKLPYLVEEIKQITGRAHYNELAILIRVAYGEPSFSEDDLKSYVRRARLRRKGSQGNSRQRQIDRSEK